MIEEFKKSIDTLNVNDKEITLIFKNKEVMKLNSNGELEIIYNNKTGEKMCLQEFIKE